MAYQLIPSITLVISLVLSLFL